MSDDKKGGGGIGWIVIGGMLGFFLIRGCGSSALPPPVTLTIRDSMFKEMGKVVQIKNDSNHHLYNVVVAGRSVSDVSGASVKAAAVLNPHDTIEVGWLQFKSWAPQSGESFEVYCDNYAIPKVIVIP